MSNMERADKREFLAILYRTADAYERKLTEGAVDFYWDALREVTTLQQVKDGITRHARDGQRGQFMPKPADVLRFFQVPAEDLASRAWRKAESAVHQVGSYASPVFDEPEIHLTIQDLGGWPQFCLTEGDRSWEFLRRDFMQIYAGYKRSGYKTYPSHLVGICENTNLKNGHDVEPKHWLELCGDKDQAQRVLEEGRKQIGPTKEEAADFMHLVERKAGGQV